MTDIVAGLRELAEPWPSGSYVKAAIDRASRAAGLPYWRAFDLWYGKARVVRDFEREAVATALTKRRTEAARNEFHELKTRLAILESRLNQIDPDFHSADVAATREQMRGLGGMDRSGNKR